MPPLTFQTIVEKCVEAARANDKEKFSSWFMEYHGQYVLTLLHMINRRLNQDELDRVAEWFEEDNK